MAEKEQGERKKPKKERSYKAKVILWTVVLMVIDEITIGIPEADLVLFYVVLFRPKWFLNMTHKLYKYVPHRRAWRPVSQICRRELVTVTVDETVTEAARLMRDHQARSLVVIEERRYMPDAATNQAGKKKSWFGKRSRKQAVETVKSDPETLLVPVGTLTDRELVLRVGAAENGGQALSVGDIMTPEPGVVLENEDINSAVEKMREAGMRRLPVVDDRGALVGLLSLDDAITVLSEGLNDMSLLLQRESQKEAAGSV